MWTSRYIPTFQRNILPPSSGLKESTYKSTQCYNPEDQYQHLKCCENLKAHIEMLIFKQELTFIDYELCLKCGPAGCVAEAYH
jgi:hypothetical protein